MKVDRMHGFLQDEGVDLVDSQASGQKVFAVRLLISEGQKGIAVRDDKSPARPDGHRNSRRPIEEEKKQDQIVGQLIRHPRRETLEDMVRHDDRFAGNMNVGEEMVATVKPEAMAKPARSVFGDLLDDGGSGH